MARKATRMTPRSVQARIRQIKETMDDPENAHGMEDSLWEDVLQAIADGTVEDPVALARAALKSTELDFPHWYA